MADTAQVIDLLNSRDLPTTLASRVYEQLRLDIVSAALLPGERLGMEALRRRYDVGGSPLREALNRLVSERFVTQLDQKGFRVASVSINELRELTQTRRLINENALRESYHRLLRYPGERGKTPESERLHQEFHCSLILGCGSRQIIQMTQQLFDQAKRYQAVSISTGAPHRDGDEEHRLIMEAVLARDIPRAVQLANDHISLTEKIVLTINKLPDPFAKLAADGQR